MGKEYFLRRLAYAKSLLMHGVEHANGGTPVDMALAVLHFDNAMEMSMQIILEFCHAPYTPERSFYRLIESVKKAVKSKGTEVDIDKIIRESELMNLRAARNNIQHHGIVPAAEEVRRYHILTEDIMSDITSELFEIQFQEISLGMLIKDETTSKLYSDAEKAFSSENYPEALKFYIAAFELAKNIEQGRIYGSGLSFKMIVATNKNTNAEKKIIRYANALAEEIEVLKLRLDYKKYQKYREISPKLKPFLFVGLPETDITQIITKIEEILGDALRKEKSTLKKHAEFCSSFAIESILRWESIPRRAWFEIIIP